MKTTSDRIDALLENLDLAVEMSRVHGKPTIYVLGKSEQGGQSVCDWEAEPFVADLRALRADLDELEARAERAEALHAAVLEQWGAEAATHKREEDALRAELARKDAALAVVQQLMDREGSCGEAGCTSIPTCEIKRYWAALAPAAPSASERKTSTEASDSQRDAERVRAQSSPADHVEEPGSPSGDDTEQPSAERVAREWWDGNSEPCECDAVHAHMTLPALDALTALILERERSAAAQGELRGWEDRSRVRAALNEMRTTYKLNRHAQTWADFIERYPNE